jgi:hypothetical protein
LKEFTILVAPIIIADVKNHVYEKKIFLYLICLILITITVPFSMGFPLLQHNLLVFIFILNILIFVFILRDKLTACTMDGSLLGAWLEKSWAILSNLVAESHVSDPYTTLFMYIGLAMLIIDIIFNTKANSLSLLDRFSFVWNNRYLLLIYFLLIFTLNIALYVLSIGIIISTTSLLLFVYTMFCKIILFRIVIIVLMFMFTGCIQLSSFYFSLVSIISIMCLSYFSLFYVMPFIVPTFIENSNIFNLFICNIFNLFSCNIEAIDLTPLRVGLIHLFKSNPITSKMMDILKLYNSKPIINTDSSFRIPYTSLSINKVVLYMRPRLSAYVPLNFTKLINTTQTLTYNIKSNNSLAVFSNIVKLNLSTIITDLHYLFTTHSTNFNARLVCDDYVVAIKAKITGCLLEEISVEASSTAKEYPSKDYFKSKDPDSDSFGLEKQKNDIDRIGRLLHNTDPCNTGYNNNPIVCVQSNISHGISEGQDDPNIYGEHSGLNMGKKRVLPHVYPGELDSDEYTEISSIHSEDFSKGTKQDKLARVEKKLNETKHTAEEIRKDVKQTINTLDEITDRKITRLPRDPVFSKEVEKGQTDIEASYRNTRTKANGLPTGPWNLSGLLTEVSLKKAFLSRYKSDHTIHEMGATNEEKHANNALRGLVKDSFKIRENLFKLLRIRNDIRSLSSDGSDFSDKNKLPKNEQRSKNEQHSKNEQSLLDDLEDVTQNMPSYMDPED